jgi:hypothetical protein
MPYKIINYPKGHNKMKYPHYMLQNLNTKKMLGKVFKTKPEAEKFVKKYENKEQSSSKVRISSQY